MMDKKTEKKKRKLIDRIKNLEMEVQTALAKKDSRTAEINVPAKMREIEAARSDLAKLG